MSGLLTERIKAANKKKGILDIWGELKRGFNNNPRNAETMDAIFGLGGIVPGVGDAASGAEALYRYNQGDMLGAGLAGLGALPMVPSMAGMIKTQRNALGQEIPPTQYELAHMEAQRVAALPVEQGGLGLPPNNTAMDRARAMGFDTDNQFFHGSRDSDKITKFTESNPSDWIGSGTYVTSNGEQASNYALYGDHSLSADTAGAPGVLPLFVNKSKTLELSSDPATRQQINDIMNSVKAVSSKKMAADFEQQAKGEPTTWDLHNIVASPDFSGREGLGSYAQEILRNAGYDSVLMRSGDQSFDKIAHGADHYTAFSPSWYDSANQKYIAGSGTNQLRSRFAAFNPAKRDSSDLLAGVLPYAAIGGLLGYGMYDEPDYGGY